MTTIIILAMAFAFVALRLWSVLGRRTGHEQPVAKPIESQPTLATPSRPTAAEPVAQAGQQPSAAPEAAAGLRAIAAADPQFDAVRFVAGAQAAYRMVLEAFWRGDEEELARLTGDEVRAAFKSAIDARKANGHTIDNRLVAVEQAIIEEARIEGQMAHVAVRFDADIAAVTHDADGNVIAGSMTDAVQTHDLWTFSRNVRSDDPNWLLTETDDAG